VLPVPPNNPAPLALPVLDPNIEGAEVPEAGVDAVFVPKVNDLGGPAVALKELNGFELEAGSVDDLKMLLCCVLVPTPKGLPPVVFEDDPA